MYYCALVCNHISHFLLALDTLVKIVMVITTETQVVMEAAIVNLEKGLNILQHKEVINIIPAVLLYK